MHSVHYTHKHTTIASDKTDIQSTHKSRNPERNKFKKCTCQNRRKKRSLQWQHIRPTPTNQMINQQPSSPWDSIEILSIRVSITKNQVKYMYVTTAALKAPADAQRKIFYEIVQRWNWFVNVRMLFLLQFLVRCIYVIMSFASCYWQVD